MTARAAVTLALALSVVACPKPPKPGEPLEGLTPGETDRFERGRAVFQRVFTPETGLGPLFNANSCIACHSDPIGGGNSAIDELHASRFEGGFCDPLAELGGPVFQLQVTQALRDALGIDAEPVPEGVDRATRSAPDVFGFGLLDAVPDSAILAMADPDDADGDGISGRPNRFFDGRLGRFGRKALVPTLAEFNEGAFQIESGVTTPNVSDEGTVGGQPIPPGVDPTPEPEVSAEDVALADAFVRFLAPVSPSKFKGAAKRGQRLFDEIGCADCHVPTLRTGDNPVGAIANREFFAYTDMLLHDLGPENADICLGLVAVAEEFRTEPLMGLRLVARFMHDGTAATIEEAIARHGGEGAASRDAFDALSDADREALLEFLGKL